MGKKRKLKEEERKQHLTKKKQTRAKTCVDGYDTLSPS
jgi:hypothetical protein